MGRRVSPFVSAVRSAAQEGGSQERPEPDHRVFSKTEIVLRLEAMRGRCGEEIAHLAFSLRIVFLDFALEEAVFFGVEAEVVLISAHHDRRGIYADEMIQARCLSRAIPDR